MAGPNDNTVFAGPNESTAAPIARVGGGTGGSLAQPNQHTVWDDHTGQKPAGMRLVDRALGDLPAQKCEKCEYSTRVPVDFTHHTKKLNGMMKCERQRAAFGAVKDCERCSGQGETTTGICSVCMGMGKIVDRNASPALAVDGDSIAKKVAEAVNASLAPSLDAIAKGLMALASGKPIKVKKQRKGKASGSSRVDHRGDRETRPAPLAPVEPAEKPLGHSSAGPEESE